MDTQTFILLLKLDWIKFYLVADLFSYSWSKPQTPEAVFFSQAGNELEASSFLAGNKFLNDFPLHLMPSWERARSQTD